MKKMFVAMPIDEILKSIDTCTVDVQKGLSSVRSGLEILEQAHNAIRSRKAALLLPHDFSLRQIQHQPMTFKGEVDRLF